MPAPRPVPATPAPAPDLPDLFERVRCGETAAFAILHREFARTVHGLLVARVGHDEAEDLTQEVFVTVFQKIDTVKEAAALPGWICTIARNAATDHQRRRGRRPVQVGGEVLHGVPAPERGDGEALARRVLELVQTLPEAYRDTLVLRLVEGLSGPEIAARTSRTAGSVRVNLTRGMAMLRPLLAREDLP